MPWIFCKLKARCLTINIRWFNTVRHLSNFTQAPSGGACRCTVGYFIIVSRRRISRSNFMHYSLISTVHEVLLLLSIHTHHLHISTSLYPYPSPSHLSARVSSHCKFFLTTPSLLYHIFLPRQNCTLFKSIAMQS